MCGPFNTVLLKMKFLKHMFIMDCIRLGNSGFIYAFKVFLWLGNQKSEKLAARSFWKFLSVACRLQPICPIEGRLGARGQAEFPLRALQFKRGLLHEFRKGNASKEQVHLHDLVQQLPKAIIIGVRKGGTRALLEMLNLHPAVVKASQEIHFFDNDENYAKGIEWYRKKMPFSYPQQITIEKSPAYFITEEVPERIYKMNSSIKLLIIVREPTTRAISDYTQVLEGKERKNKTYYKFEKLAIDPNTCEVNTKYKAVRTSIYTCLLYTSDAADEDSPV